jgi:undecaprenyl-diphosphatase
MHFLDALDQDVLHGFQALHRPWLDRAMLDVSALGGVTVLTLVVIFAVGLLLALRRRRTAGFVLMAALGGVLLVWSVKHAVGRTRPHVAHPLVVELGKSFPSGHSMLSAVIYLTLALIAAAVIPARRVRAYVIGTSLLLAFLVGVSRMYLGVHYFTDVVAGWSAGLAWALLCRWVEYHWVVRAERRAAKLEEKLADAIENERAGTFQPR